MKILFSVFRYHTNMVSMVRAFKEEGHEVLIVTVNAEENEDTFEASPLVIDPLFTSLQVENIFRSFLPDVIVVREALNERVAKIFTSEARKKKIKVVSYEQNSCFSKSRLRALYKGMHHAATQMKKGLPVTELSPKPGELNGFKIPFRKFFFFPMCLSYSDKEREYCPERVVRITTVGKLGVPRKRLEWVVNAVKPFSNQVRVNILGSNDIAKYPETRSREYYDKLYRITKSMRDEGSLRITENLPFWEMQKMYKNTDIFVLSAKGEKFGVSPLEAMESGCAVICADDNGSSPYIENGYDGLVFNSPSYEDFSVCLHSLIENSQEILRIGRNAKRTIKERHSCKNFVSVFCDLVGVKVK